jgi:hypothetical protein
MINKIPDKSKSVSILLAIFLSYWTCLYTYKFDYKNFWLGLISNFITIIAILSGNFMFLFFISMINLGIWLAAILNVTLRDDKIYDNYWSIKVTKDNQYPLRRFIVDD